MARKKIRDEKTCLNCGAEVEKSFCPECGQKNTEERRAFYVLFTEFFSTMFNYDNSFWQTTSDLFLAPGKLSREYIRGKRNSYLKPVQMYLFASFIAFFIPTIMPDDDMRDTDPPVSYEEKGMNISFLTEEYGKPTTRAELDSIYYAQPEEERSPGKHLVARLSIRIMQNYQKPVTYGDRIFSFISENFPKMIFIYMPFFAFLLWLVHSKKKWYYYDSGVFTLHFFTFILLVVSILHLLSPALMNLLDLEWLFVLLVFGAILYITIYFYIAHHVFYEEKRWVSRLKASFLIFINFFFIILSIAVFFLLAALL